MYIFMRAWLPRKTFPSSEQAKLLGRGGVEGKLSGKQGEIPPDFL